MLRPVTRILVGLIAIPVFRFLMRRVFRLQDMNDELEKDLEQWFRASLLLLAATANMEHLLFGWVTHLDWLDRADWFTMGLRLMLAIGVIQTMPDQEIFAVIHPGPPKLKPGRSMPVQLWKQKWAILKGIVCQHLNRSSPVLAMMCAIVGAQLPIMLDSDTSRIHQNVLASTVYAGVGPITAPCCVFTTGEQACLLVSDAQFSDVIYQRHWERWMVGWVCYLMAITQYLIIGLITSRDRAMDVLHVFDTAVAARRRELIDEFNLHGRVSEQDAAKAAAAVSRESLGATASADGPATPEQEHAAVLKDQAGI